MKKKGKEKDYTQFSVRNKKRHIGDTTEKKKCIMYDGYLKKNKTKERKKQTEFGHYESTKMIIVLVFEVFWERKRVYTRRISSLLSEQIDIQSGNDEDQ